MKKNKMLLAKAVCLMILLSSTSNALNTDSLRTVADNLYSRGINLWESGNTSQAMDYLNNSLELYLDIGYQMKADGSYPESIQDFKKALLIYTMILGENDESVAGVYSELGFIYWKLGDYSQAREHYEKSLDIRLKQSPPDYMKISICYTNIGHVDFENAQFTESVHNHKRALYFLLQVPDTDKMLVAENYTNLGYSYYRLDSLHEALACHLKALENNTSVLGASHPTVARNYTDIGYIFFEQGDIQNALDNQTKAIDIRKRILGENHPDLAANYTILAAIRKKQGKPDMALDLYLKAMEIHNNKGNQSTSELAADYVNIGTLYLSLGSYQLALENLNQALKIYSDLGEILSHQTANVHNNIGSVYLNLGQYEQALQNFTKALDIDIKVLGANHPEIASRHGNIGSVYSRTGFYSKALDQYLKALTIWGNNSDQHQSQIATTYNNMGVVYANMSNPAKALDYYRKALNIKLKTAGPADPSLAFSFNNIAGAYTAMGQYSQALEYFRKALTSWESSLGKEHPLVGGCCGRIGLAYKAAGKNDSALTYLKRSVDIFEKSRGEIEAEELQIAYSETATQRYDAIVSLLMDLGRPQEAFSYLERSKSVALKTSAAAYFDSDTIGTGKISEDLAESNDLARQVESLETQLAEEYTKPDSLRDEEKVENINNLLAQTKAEYFKIASQVQSDPDYASLVRVNPTDIGVLQKELPAGQKLLMFYCAEKSLYLFLVSADGYQVRSVEVKRERLDSLISQVRKYCSKNQINRLYQQNKLFSWTWSDDGSEFYRLEVAPFKQALSSLYGYLIAPFESELASTRVITFVPSGQMYYIPWGALIAADGGAQIEFLAQRYNWNVLTSTELFECIYRRSNEAVSSPTTLLLVGNPTGANLPSSEAEIKSILQTYPGSTSLVGAYATEPQVEATAGSSQVLHLATHCILNTHNPWESYIHLASSRDSDGHWTAAEITNQSWNNIQLVTLSACETAVGGNRPGLELESVAKAFSLAMEGPPSIIATLWSVADESTKEFMVTFYQELKTNSKSEALRRAQLKLINSTKYNHPFFWAPFILIGEWR